MIRIRWNMTEYGNSAKKTSNVYTIMAVTIYRTTISLMESIRSINSHSRVRISTYSEIYTIGGMWYFKLDQPHHAGGSVAVVNWVGNLLTLNLRKKLNVAEYWQCKILVKLNRIKKIYPASIYYPSPYKSAFNNICTLLIWHSRRRVNGGNA